MSFVILWCCHNMSVVRWNRLTIFVAFLHRGCGNSTLQCFPGSYFSVNIRNRIIEMAGVKSIGEFSRQPSRYNRVVSHCLCHKINRAGYGLTNGQRRQRLALARGNNCSAVRVKLCDYYAVRYYTQERCFDWWGSADSTYSLFANTWMKKGLCYV